MSVRSRDLATLELEVEALSTHDPELPPVGEALVDAAGGAPVVEAEA